MKLNFDSLLIFYLQDFSCYSLSGNGISVQNRSRNRSRAFSVVPHSSLGIVDFFFPNIVVLM